MGPSPSRRLSLKLCSTVSVQGTEVDGESSKTVPQPLLPHALLVPPAAVVPYTLPALSSTTPPYAYHPSCGLVVELNVYSVSQVQGWGGTSLKTVAIAVRRHKGRAVDAA